MSDTELSLRDYAPRPMLRVPNQGPPLRPRFPVIDAHNHLGPMTWGSLGAVSGDWPSRPVAEMIAVMDEAGVETIVNLDGGWGEGLRAELARYQEPYPGRFVVFAGIDGDGFARDPRFGETEAARLRDSAAAGARGLKIWKRLGLELRDDRGRLIAIDDERLDPLWETAGALGLPVLIHIADPVAFFQPLDRHNERYEELIRHPDWHFFPTRPAADAAAPGFPPFLELMEQFLRLLTRHRDTIFIGAHVGCYAEDLTWVGETLDACPNLVVDISARLNEIGRAPYAARDFFLRYQDRILFGTDAAPRADVYRLYYRVLETRDEYFPYSLEEPPGAGRWRIYGLDLPDEVLEKVYRGNGRRVLGLDGAPQAQAGAS
jgi:predicted TIM-barrel fold metal-dependent hydrolase